MDLMHELVGEHRDSRFGYSTASLDFNGDSTDDLVVGSRGWDPDYYVTGNTTNIGKLYFILVKKRILQIVLILPYQVFVMMIVHLQN